MYRSYRVSVLTLLAKSKEFNVTTFTTNIHLYHLWISQFTKASETWALLKATRTRVGKYCGTTNAIHWFVLLINSSFDAFIIWIVLDHRFELPESAPVRLAVPTQVKVIFDFFSAFETTPHRSINHRTYMTY